MSEKFDRNIPHKFFHLISQLPKHDMRIGQFLMCVFHEEDIFNIENDELVERMEKFFEDNIL